MEGGAAFHDGRLQAGDQLLKVDGKSLVGITQERAADIMMHTGQVVELEVAKQVRYIDVFVLEASLPNEGLSLVTITSCFVFLRLSACLYSNC